MMGMYNFHAVSIALGNAFRKKGSKPMEYIKYPFLQTAVMTEREKDAQRKLFVAKLQAMQANFELNHKPSDEESQSLPVNS